MSRRAQGARLWLKPAERGRDAVWVIKDGKHRESTGCGPGEVEAAERKLREYLANKYQVPRIKQCDPSDVKLADVIKIYADDVASGDSRPKEIAKRLERLLAFFGENTLADINTALCKRYLVERGKQAAARRELEDLRAAIGHHWKEGLCATPVPVWIPARGTPRERWLTRSEAARLLWAAYRYREIQKGQETGRYSRRHVARFILVGLYTGTRASAICGAALTSAVGRGWVDLDAGVFYRRAAGAVETKKRQPTIPIPPRLLAHMRRWRRLGLSTKAVVEFNGEPIKKINCRPWRRRRAARAAPQDGVSKAPDLVTAPA
jgi:hypothetical protein